MAITRVKLSGSTNGLGIKVTGTSSAADVTIHTADATALDQVWLYAINNDVDGEVRTLTVAWGAETDPDNLIITTVPCKAGPILITPGLVATGSVVIGAWADEASDVVIYGYVDRIS